MKIIITILLSALFSSNTISQTINEKEIFKLPSEYKGTVDVYNFTYNSSTGSYCYSYRIEGENKSFIISKNGMSGEENISQKYDYIDNERIEFDEKGNYFAVASNYKPDYGSDNYFLLVNGKEARNANLIDSYTSYVNKKGEYTFIFKDKDIYKLGYYSADGQFRESSPYDNIRAIYKYVNYGGSGMEEGEGSYNPDYFYLNENGERGYVGNANGKTDLIFETSVINTPYTDINETSLTKNRNDELSYIAKTGGKFYEKVGNEFVVSGNKEYAKFELVSSPVIFNESNVPVYSGGDSLTESKYDYYLVVGNSRSPVVKDGKTKSFSYGISDIKITGGNITYIGMGEEIIYAAHKDDGQNNYDQYYSKSYFVDGGRPYEMGYNLHPVIYSKKGEMMYSGLGDLIRKESLLMMNYGESKIILSKKRFDDIYGYGFSPAGQIYYIGQNYDDSAKNQKNESYLYLGDNLIGNYDYISFQGTGDNSSVIKFDSKNNYAFVADIKKDSDSYSNNVITNTGKLPFPSSTVTNSKYLSFISNLMYTKDDKLFFIADMDSDPVTFVSTKEVFVDNASLGKIYNTIDDFKYDEVKNQIMFTATRGNGVYLVQIDF